MNPTNGQYQNIDDSSRQSPDDQFSKRYLALAADAYMRERGEDLWKVVAPVWLPNIRQNIPEITMTLSPEHQVDDGLQRLANRINTDQVFVFASGASLKLLEPHAGRIARELPHHGLIFASPTVIPWLRRMGIKHDATVVTDQNKVQADYLGPNLNNEILFAPPFIDPSIRNRFKSRDVYWFNHVMTDGAGGVMGNPFSRFLMMLLSPPIRQIYVQLGCVTNAMLPIIRGGMDEGILNAKRIVLIGADYSFWDNLGRVPILDEEFQPPPEDSDNFIFDGVYTNKRMVGYKYSLIWYWMSTLTKIYSCSHGLLHELPFVSMIDNILKDRYPEYPTNEEVVQMGRSFLFDVFPRKFLVGEVTTNQRQPDPLETTYVRRGAVQTETA